MNELIELSRMRVAIYRMFSSLYFKELTESQIGFFSKEGLPQLEGLAGDVAAGARLARGAIRRVDSLMRENLAVDYAHTMLAAGSTKGEDRACPFESIYTSPEGLLMGDARDSVYKAMLHESLLPDCSLHIPEDHLSFEFDFMGDMASATASALEEGDCDEARRLLGVQRDFHRDHQLNWVGKYCEAVDACCRTDFYRGVAMMTRGWVDIETELLDESMQLLAS